MKSPQIPPHPAWRAGALPDRRCWRDVRAVSHVGALAVTRLAARSCTVPEAVTKGPNCGDMATAVGFVPSEAQQRTLLPMTKANHDKNP